MLKLKLASCFLTLGAFACATTPKELVEARVALTRASNGPAARLAPAQLDTAKQALDRAEVAWDEGDDGAVDLAYVAQRKAQLAEVKASIQASLQAKEKNEARAQVALRDKLTETQDKLVETEGNAAAMQQAQQERMRATEAQMKQRDAVLQEKDAALEQSKARVETERTAREAAEAKAAELERRSKDLEGKLQKIADVKKDERGLVLALPGTILFASGSSTLLPGAAATLNRVVDALSEAGNRKLLIEGHTDSAGSDVMNEELSTRRAQSVADYMKSRGMAHEVEVLGAGEGRPISDNATAAGRAINRRVEIIVRNEAS